MPMVVSIHWNVARLLDVPIPEDFQGRYATTYDYHEDFGAIPKLQLNIAPCGSEWYRSSSEVESTYMSRRRRSLANVRK